MPKICGHSVVLWCIWLNGGGESGKNCRLGEHLNQWKIAFLGFGCISCKAFSFRTLFGQKVLKYCMNCIYCFEIFSNLVVVKGESFSNSNNSIVLEIFI